MWLSAASGELTQANIAFGFLMLAARGMGYCTNLMLGFDTAKLRQIFNLPEHLQFASIMPVGIRDGKDHSHHRHNIDRIAKFI